MWALILIFNDQGMTVCQQERFAEDNLLTHELCVFQWNSKGLALVFCILQYLAMTWYVQFDKYIMRDSGI